MQAQGWRIIPINPNASTILGERAYPSLSEAARHERIELVNVFRNSADALAVVEEALKVGAKAIWLQLGVLNAQAQRLAEEAGLPYVQDQCLKVQWYRRGAR
jgi:predicted CoA-binding protein